MKAARIHEFGPPSVIVIEDLPRPTPGPGRSPGTLAAAGVGPWDGWIRAHILGLDNSGSSRYREFEVTARYKFRDRDEFVASCVRSSAVGDLTTSIPTSVILRTQSSSPTSDRGCPLGCAEPFSLLGHVPHQVWNYSSAGSRPPNGPPILDHQRGTRSLAQDIFCAKPIWRKSNSILVSTLVCDDRFHRRE